MNLKFLLFKWKWYGIIFLISGLFAFLLGREIELVLFFICYCNLRYMFPKTFHHNNFYHCIFWSIVMMITATYNALSIHISILANILLAYIVGIILYFVKDYIDKKTELANKKITDSTKFTEELLNEWFIKLKTPAQYRPYLIAVLVHGQRDVDWFNLPINRDNIIDEQQYRNYKSKFLKKLKNGK